MAKIVIDARESGTSTGRYIDKLVENIHILKPDYEMVIIIKAHRLDFFKGVAPNFICVSSPFKEFSFGEQLGLKKQIESLKPDLVHFGIVQQPILYRGRVVTTMHDLITTRYKNPSKNPVIFTIKQQVYRWLVRKVAKKSRLIITPTEFVKNDVVVFTGIDPNKVIVTLESADVVTEAAQPLKALEGKKFIMYIGRPMPHKNLTRLIEAFVILQASFPDLYLVLAGKKDSLYEKHEQNVIKSNIKNVIFTGFITDGELRWLYEHTACYVFPSLSEGFGLPGLEAMAHGAPVASSNTTCLPEVYGNAAEYFDPLSVDAISTSVKLVLSDKKRADELRSLGRKQAASYSWQRTAQQTLDVYKKALQQ